MAEIICNTSPLQYLHQLGQLELLHKLAGRVIVPPAVVEELSVGRSRGFNVPDPETLDWISIQQPKGAVVLPLVIDLGAGESAVLALALESEDAQVVLDDALARRMAETLNIPLKGTLGILLDAKRAGLITTIRPLLDQLQALRFRLSPTTRTAVLKLAGELA